MTRIRQDQHRPAPRAAVMSPQEGRSGSLRRRVAVGLVVVTGLGLVALIAPHLDPVPGLRVARAAEAHSPNAGAPDATAPAPGGAAPMPRVRDAASLEATLDAIFAAAFPGRTLRWSLPREHRWEPAAAGASAGAASDYRLIVPEVLCGGRNWFHLQPPGDAGAFLLPVEVSWQDTAWVALRALSAGHILTAGDLDRQVCWHSLPPGEVRACSDPLGGRLVESVARGALMTTGLIGTPPLVERGDIVRLVYRSSGLEVATRASAMEEGWAGDAIRVQPLDSRRVCQARVCGAGEAEVIIP